MHFLALAAELRVMVYKYLFFSASRQESRGLYLACHLTRNEMDYEFFKLHLEQLEALTRHFSTDDCNINIDFKMPTTIQEALYPEFRLTVDRGVYGEENIADGTNGVEGLLKATSQLLLLRNIESVTFRSRYDPIPFMNTGGHGGKFQKKVMEGGLSRDLEEVLLGQLKGWDGSQTSGGIHASKVLMNLRDCDWELYLCICPWGIAWSSCTDVYKMEDEQSEPWDWSDLGCNEDTKMIGWERVKDHQK